MRDQANIDGQAIVMMRFLERLAEGLRDLGTELGQFIQPAPAVVGQRHLARHRPVAPTDPPRVRNGVVGGATRACGDQGGAVAGEAGDAVNAGGVKGFGQGHRWQDGGESPGQPRLGRPRGPSRRMLWSQRLHSLQLYIRSTSDR
jgi:hypothetical protein